MRYAHLLLSIPLLTLWNVAPAHAGWSHDRHDRHDSHWRSGHHYPYGRSSVFLPHRSITIVIGGGKYHYGDGHFYRRRAYDYVVVPAPVGAVIYSLPAGCSRVAIAGGTYYMHEGVYYRPHGRGYRVVESPLEAPVAYAPASTKPQDAFTVNIPNGNGGFTSVTLKRSGQGFVGPQGEYYPEFPKVEELRTIYANNAT
jgi:hypothetical protein